jgi:hypothetical protein
MAVERNARAKVPDHRRIPPKEVYVTVFHNSPLINQPDTRGVTSSFQFEQTFNQENVFLGETGEIRVSSQKA